LPRDLPFGVDRTFQVPGVFTSGMVSAGGWLYLLSAADGTPTGGSVLSRLDRVTGVVTASRVLARVSTMAAGGGYVWASVNDGPLRPSSVLQLDPTTLASVHTVPLPHTPGFSSSIGNVESAGAMAYAGGHLWVAFSHWWRAIDPATGTVVRTVNQDGEFADAVAASPDGRTLWTSGYRSDTRSVPVDQRDAQTGAVLASTTTVATRFVPTTTGTWVTVVTGMLAHFAFLTPAGHNLLVTDHNADSDTGPNGQELASAAGVLWITDIHAVQCADLATGRILAGSANDGFPSYGPVADVSRTQFAIVAAAAHTGQQEVLIAHPRPACRA
jgi:hypothetical protein